MAEGRREPPAPYCDREESKLVARYPHWKQALKANHPTLRIKIRVKNVQAGFRTFLSDVEYERVTSPEKDNVDKVDNLVTILLTKEARDFERLLLSLNDSYKHLAVKLAMEAGGYSGNGSCMIFT